MTMILTFYFHIFQTIWGMRWIGGKVKRSLPSHYDVRAYIASGSKCRYPVKKLGSSWFTAETNKSTFRVLKWWCAIRRKRSFCRDHSPSWMFTLLSQSAWMFSVPSTFCFQRERRCIFDTSWQSLEDCHLSCRLIYALVETLLVLSSTLMSNCLSVLVHWP